MTTRNAVNSRSILIGLIGVIFICSFTAFNDYVLGNTFLVGNFLPPGVLLFFLTIIAVINAPLRKWKPAWALSGGELAVSLAMMLVSCTLPSSGLMRYLPPSLVAIPNQAGTNATFGQLVQQLDLPAWMFPKFDSADPVRQANEPVIRQYITRTDLENPTFLNRVRAVPWRRWATPAATWGILMAAVYGMVLCMAAIVRHQWVENERLSFPLASVYSALIEPPPEGKAFNAMLRSRSFWIAAACVFAVHGMNALHQYVLRCPQIPLKFDLSSVLANDPWRWMDTDFKTARLYFAAVGICFYLQSSLAFSLWFFFVLVQVARMVCGTQNSELTDLKQVDQSLGAQLVFAATIVWIGRAHWMMILRQMVRGPAPGETKGKYLPYPVAGWGFIGCCLVMGGWLLAVGVTVIGAIALVISICLLMLGISRIVAETGLVFGHMRWAMDRPWLYGQTEFPVVLQTTSKTFFLSSWLTGIFAYGQRENAAVYATHALKVADDAEPSIKPGWKLIACMAGALALGYLLSGASMLFVEYGWDQRLSHQSEQVNEHGLGVAEQRFLPSTIDYRDRTVRDSHWRLGHFALGAGITAALSLLRLRFAAWPLHPIGYLLVYSYPMQMIWFSVFVGWLMKVLILRVTGAQGFQRAKYFFIGLIIGEAAAAAFWLLVSVICAAAGWDYYSVSFLPG